MRKNSILLLIVACLLSMTAQHATATTEGFLPRDTHRSAKEAVQEILQAPKHVQKLFFATMQIRTNLSKQEFLLKALEHSRRND